MAYQHRSLPISAQNLINLYVEVQPPDAKGRVTLLFTPGLNLFTTAGSGPIRGLHNFNGTLYAVSGNELYKITADTTATLQTGSIAGSKYVDMANNISQLAIATGGSGGFVFNGTTVSKITDSDFQGVNTCEFQHQRIIWDGNNGNFQLSELNDAGNYTSINIADAEGVPDDTIAVKTKGDEAWLFGRLSVELWSDRGGSLFPYERSPGAIIHIGLAAPHAVALKNNVMYWLGHNYQIYASSDLIAQPISTPAIAAYISRFYVDDCVARAYSHMGQDFVEFTFRASQRTLCYGITTGRWHEKSYYDNSFPDNRAAHRGQGHAWCYGKNFVGDFENGNIYILDDNKYTDNGTLIMREATAPPLSANGQEMFFGRFFLDQETGRGLVSGQGSDPKGYLSWADDDGRTFGTDLETKLGGQGNYLRAEWNRLGSTNMSRVYRYRYSEPTPGAIVGAYSEHEIDAL